MFQLARRLSFAFVMAIVGPFMIFSAAQAQIPYLQVPAAEPRYSAIVVDANTGEVLYSKRADSPRYPASITKIMTLYLAFEALSEGRLHLDDTISVSEHAAAQAPTKLGLDPGETISVDDAMRAIAVKSANDMAVALAEKLGGTEGRFAALMTLRAQELGMSNTRFVNASGLPDSRQISTARDIAILSRSAMRDYPQYYKYFSIRQFAFRGSTMNNHNGLLGKMPGVDGLKTGFTSASGFNLAASAVQDGQRLIAVVMGGSSTAARDNNVEDLLETGFDIGKRRARGEKIMVAQNMFEAEPAQGPIMRPSTEQGDGEQSNLRIILANNPSSGMAPIPDPDEADAQAAPLISHKAAREPAHRKSRGEWGVQVGAFKAKAQAKAQLQLAKARFARVLGSAEGVVDAAGRQFRAQFLGLTAEEARAACKAIGAKRMPCAVLSAR